MTELCGDVPPPPPDLAAQIRDEALALGFCRVGFAPVQLPPRGAAALRRWLAHGYHGAMSYMAEHGPRDDAREIFAATQTVVVVAMAYDKHARDVAPETASGAGFVARYARGADYHWVLRQRLQQLAEACQRLLGRSIAARACVDTAPLLEREMAARAGVAFTGKSTMGIAPGIGTYLLFGELLIDAEIAPSAPLKPRCGKCTACLDACPTGAFVDPYVLDARRCIAYLTIELRGPIPRALRPHIGNMVFGCDICQQVCPFNHSPKPHPASPALRRPQAFVAPDLVALLQLTSSGYRRLVRNTALRRVSRQQLARNAAVALGNSGLPTAVSPLRRALAEHPSPLVRGHAAWALGALKAGATALTQAAAQDPDPTVRDEARLALPCPTTPVTV